MQSVIIRIIFAYIGAVLLPIILLPIAMIKTMAGHSLMYLTVFASPVGLMMAILFYDVKRGLPLIIILLRTFVALTILILFFMILIQTQISPFFINKGWLLIPIVGPPLAAGISEFVGRNTARIKD